MSATLLHETLAAARARLVSAGIAPEEAAVDVDLFARQLLGWDRAQLILARTAPPPEGFEPRLAAWIDRRAKREPSAYIVTTREFWGLDFTVTPAVLVPRPETELLVEEALRLLGTGNQRAEYPARIADIGTGSGCIAVALAHALPAAHVVATDISADALTVALQNAGRHGVAARIEFLNTPYLGGVEGDFDLIAANPPYIRDADLPTLPPEVRHEPPLALAGGDNGLRDIEGVLETAAAKLRPRGWLLMEFGIGQERDLRRLVANTTSLSLNSIRPDLQSIPRVAVIQRSD